MRNLFRNSNTTNRVTVTATTGTITDGIITRRLDGSSTSLKGGEPDEGGAPDERGVSNATGVPVGERMYWPI